MKKISMACAAIATSLIFGVQANNPYGDWGERIETVYETVQFYGGYYTCKYQQQAYGLDVFNPGPNRNHIVEKSHSEFLANQTVPRPILNVIDGYMYSHPNGSMTVIPHYLYQCHGIADLPKTHTETRAVGSRTVYYPIPPFTTFSNRYFNGCHDGINQDVSLNIDTAGGSTMIVSNYYNGTNNPSPTVLYSGPATEWIGLTLPANSPAEITVKIDSGSTIGNIFFVPSCDNPISIE